MWVRVEVAGVLALTININLNMGDMLPLVNASTARLLNGHSPYYVYQMPYDLPLTYWPLNLLPYVPFRTWGLDLRLANLLFGFAVGDVALAAAECGRA